MTISVFEDIETVRRALASIPDRAALLAFERLVRVLRRETEDTRRTEIPR